MADLDFSSMAYSLIPGIAGLISGGPLGGLSGFARGVSENDAEQEKQRRYESELALKNREDARQQEELAINRQTTAGQIKHWETADQAAGVAMELHKTQQRESERKMKQLELEDVAFAEAIADKPLAEQRVARADRAKYIEAERKKISEEPDRASMAVVLQGLGVPNAKTWAKSGDLKDMNQAVQQMAVARSSPGRIGHFAVGDTTYLYNDKDGKFWSVGTGAKTKTMTPEKRTQIEAGLLREWKAENPTVAKFAEESDDFSKYQQWRTSPLGELSEQFLNGEITAPERSQRRAQILAPQLREQHIEKQFEEAYMGAGAKQSAEGFEKYKKTPEGKANFKKYQEALAPEAKKLYPGGGSARTAAPEKSAPKALDLPPPAKENAGRVIRDTATGKRFKSDGNAWIPQ